MSSHDEVRKAIEFIKDAGIAMLTTLDGDTQLVSRPLTVLQVEDDGDLWFFTHEATSQAIHVTANNAVNAAFSTGKEWVSVSGTARTVRDQDEID